VRGISKLSVAAVLLALPLTAGFAACGGGDSSSTASEASSSRTEAKPKGEASARFVPKRHHDSGGGSKQFEVKGGDNSVQEFGAEASASELDRAATALHDFLDARAEGNWAAACSFLAKSTVESFKGLASGAKRAAGASCAEVLEKLTNPAARQALKAEAAKANVGSLRIEGERAFVIYTGTGGTVLAMPMAHEGGAWKVASLASVPLS
jgi:hypothetical protein